MIDEISALVEIVVFYKLFDEIDVLLEAEVAVGAVVPARAAHRQKIVNIIVIVTELKPRRYRAEREAAERAVVARGFQIGVGGRFGVRVILSLDRRHQVFFEIAVELSEFLYGRREIRIAVCVVECRRYDDHRFHIAFGDHIVEHILLRGKLKVFSRVTAPTVHKIEDIISRFCIVLVITVRCVNVSGLGDRAAVSDVII